MKRLVYVSSATREMSESELVQLLEQSRDRNKRQHVTGMLLYAGGNFFQVLEGEAKDVDEIYAAITLDKRNKGNIVLVEDEIPERTFPQWSMGFRHFTGRDAGLEGYTEFMNKKLAPKAFANISDKVIDLLYSFKEGNP